jgi:hypothetical protein
MNELTPGANAALPLGDMTVLIRHGTIARAEIDGEKKNTFERISLSKGAI